MLLNYFKNSSSKDFGLVLTADEESGQTGIQSILSQLPALKYAIVCEPTNGSLVTSHPGVSGIRIRLDGEALHASEAKIETNTIMKMASFLDQVVKPLCDDKNPIVNVGLIEGGTRANITPSNCTATLNLRYSQIKPDDFIQSIEKKKLKKTVFKNIKIEKYFDFPAFKTSLKSKQLEDIFKRLKAKDKDTVSFYSEAGFLEKSGIPSVVWGHGDIARAHTQNEYITTNELQRMHDSISNFFDRK